MIDEGWCRLRLSSMPYETKEEGAPMSGTEDAADTKRDGGDFVKGCQHHHEQAATCTRSL